MTIHLTNLWGHVRGGLAVTLLLCGLALAETTMPDQAFAQAGSPLQFTSTNRNMLRAQLDLAITFAQQAQGILQSAPDERGLERAVALNYESYTLLRFAHEGVLKINGSAQKAYANPLLQMVAEAIQQARYRNLKARAEMKDSIQFSKERHARIQAAINAIQEMVRLAREAAELL